jgi:hypothetical protein
MQQFCRYSSRWVLELRAAQLAHGSRWKWLNHMDQTGLQLRCYRVSDARKVQAVPFHDDFLMLKTLGHFEESSRSFRNHVIVTGSEVHLIK